jgi:hypothetical protein
MGHSIDAEELLRESKKTAIHLTSVRLAAQAQVHATLEVAEEIRALREAVEGVPVGPAA